jgi:hypothetical protein
MAGTRRSSPLEMASLLEAQSQLARSGSKAGKPLVMSLRGGSALSGGAVIFCSIVEASPRRSNLQFEEGIASLALAMTLDLKVS